MSTQTKPLAADSLQQHFLSGHISASGRLQALHDRLLQALPHIERIACALYDSSDDTLTTFINSTRSGQALPAYHFLLADSPSLSALARDASVRMLDDLSHTLQPKTMHTRWLLDQGYQSSFTVPMYDQRGLLGFIFFDSLQLHAFPEKTQRDLLLYSNLISMTISNEVETIRSLRASTHLACEFAHLRDFETGAHLQRMSHYAKLIASAVAPHYQLSDEFIEHVFWFAPLHDIGKIGIPDSILLKQGSLDAAERQIMESHVDKGLEIIGKLIEDFGLGDFPDTVELRNIVGCHHELLDGSGYPCGLRGDAIPVSARIVSVADIYDALTTVRPYKQPWSHAQAMQELYHMAELGKLDLRCVQALDALADQVQAIQIEFKDS
ncbi:HD domain-containing phosphohydrolase [Duganella fentianensis]|uniref:HD-GYP domain-containing protein n=1 Tax=Duganella fentianensis TaxID=2692177 RepID=UPI0032B1135F